MDTGFSCCGRKIREYNYNQTYVLLGANEEFVPDPKGCTPCDCGVDLQRMHIDSFADIVDTIDITKWKGFSYPYLYRSKDTFESRS